MSEHGKHTANPGYKAGEHWNVCQRCGFDIYESDTIEEWTGLRVCSSCWESRHPQDFIREVKEDTSAQGLVTSDINRIEDTVTLQDNTSPTLTSGTDNREHNWNTALTANRAITFAPSTKDYEQFLIYRTGAGPFTLDVGGLQTIPANVNGVCIVKYIGGAWVLDAYYTI